MSTVLVDLAARLVDAYYEAAQQRADNDDPSSWMNADTGRRWCEVVRGCHAERVGEREIVVTAPATDDGRMFGYVASDLIDSACAVVDPDGSLTESGYIEPVVDRQRYRFTWAATTAAGDDSTERP